MRTWLVLIIGMLAGAAGTYYLTAMQSAPGDTGGGAAGAGAGAAVTPGWMSAIGLGAGGGAEADAAAAPAGPAPPVAERLSVYALAAAADAAELLRHIERTAAGPGTRTTGFTLEVLLARLAELDPARAVRAATDLELPAALLAPLCQALAAHDLNAAQRALGRVRDARAATACGLAVLDVLGNDARGVERLLAAMPYVDAERFRLAALGARAATAPADALAQALAIADPRMRGRALDEVAKAWSALDARDALGRVDLIGEAALRARFEGAVLREWSSREPLAALEYALTARPQRMNVTQMIVSAMQNLPPSEAAQALELAARFPGNTGRIARQFALQQLAQLDPEAALAHVETLPPGPERQQFVQVIASSYGSVDADAALAWARTMQPPIPGLVASVLGGAAAADPQRAFDIALGLPPADRAQALQGVVVNAARSGTDARALAERLIEMPESSMKQQALQSLTMAWAAQGGEDALAWLVANAGRVHADAFRSAVNTLPQREPEAAAAYVDQVPAELRAEWITAVAAGYARTDPQRALEWIGRFRGDPAYETGIAAVVQNLAQVDPRSAAGLLEDVGADPQLRQRVAMTVAMQWGRQDPPAAAQWAVGLADAGGAVALGIVAQQWAAQDAQSARGWVLSLPNGAARDRALGSIIAITASNETPDGRLLGAFSSDQAREQALPAAVFAIAQRDRAQAQAFMERHITDPGVRQQAQQMLENASRSRGFMMGQPVFGVQPFGAIGPSPAIGVGMRAVP